MDLDSVAILRIGYLIDLAVSLPLGWAMVVGDRKTLTWLVGDDLPSSQSLRTTLGSLWIGIVVCLGLGLLRPIEMAAVLVLQLVYKGLWLMAFAIPRWWSGRTTEVPVKVAGLYAAYVLVYPWIIPWSSLFQQRN